MHHWKATFAPKGKNTKTKQTTPKKPKTKTQTSKTLNDT
jgi:hypothetical protein